MAFGFFSLFFNFWSRLYDSTSPVRSSGTVALETPSLHHEKPVHYNQVKPNTTRKCVRIEAGYRPLTGSNSQLSMRLIFLYVDRASLTEIPTN